MPAAHLIQITDCHIHADPRVRHGRDSHATLAAVVDAIGRGPAPDLVLATGDLVDDGSPAAYARLAPLLHRLPAPVHAIPGNHDDPAAMAGHLAGGNIHVGSSAVVAGAWAILLLDTLVPGEPHGHLGEAKLAALDAALATAREPHVLVALHHPPAPIGSPLDDVGLTDAEALHAVLDRYEHVRVMVWGHNHHEHDSTRNGVRRLGTPSTWIQFDARPEVGFTRTAQPPAWRSLRLHDDGTVETQVHWLSDRDIQFQVV